MSRGRSNSVIINTVLLILVISAAVGAAVYSGVFAGLADSGAADEDELSNDSSAWSMRGIPIEFGPFVYDAPRLRREFDEERAEHTELALGPSADQVIEAYATVSAQAAMGAVDPRVVSALTDAMESLLRNHGPDGIHKVGWTLYGRFATAIETVEAERGPMTGTEWLQQDAEGREALRRDVGNFFLVAEGAGLTDESGRLNLEPELRTVLFRFLWFSVARDYHNSVLMTPYENVVFLRWRIEQAPNLSLPERLSLLNGSEAIYTGILDPQAVRGILSFQEGQLETAANHFRRALHADPGNSRYRGFLSRVESLMEGSF